MKKINLLLALLLIIIGGSTISADTTLDEGCIVYDGELLCPEDLPESCHIDYDKNTIVCEVMPLGIGKDDGNGSSGR